MANVYVRSGAAGGGTGADWANAFTTLAAALTAKAAGDSFWVSEDHAETQASAMTLTSPGTVGNPCFVYCVNHAGSVPPVSADLRTTATVTTTGANSITIAGFAYSYGIAFSAGSGAAANFVIGASGIWSRWDSCAFILGGTSGTLTFGSGANAANRYEWVNTTYSVTAAGSTIIVTGGEFLWSNTASAIQGATLPTTLFAPNRPSTIILDGVDLSALGAGKTLLAATPGPDKVYLKDCKLGASITVAAQPTAPGCDVYLIRSDSAATNYRSEKYSYTGTETTETTIIRTGGASDGATPQSRKIVTTANAKWVLPFQGLPIAIWNDTVGSPVTVTVHAVSGAAGLLNKDDVWMDVEYLGSSATPQGSFATNTKADNLAASVAYTGDGAAWAGLPSGTPFSMSVTFTPQQKGTIYIYPKVGKASATVYIDPVAVLS